MNISTNIDFFLGQFADTVTSHVKLAQGDKGYINTWPGKDSRLRDTMYAYLFDDWETWGLHEHAILALRCSEDNILEYLPIGGTVESIDYGDGSGYAANEERIKNASRNEWHNLEDEDTLFEATLASICRYITEYL